MAKKYNLNYPNSTPKPLFDPFNWIYNKVIGTANYISSDSKNPIYIDLKDKNIKNLNDTDKAEAVLANDFVERKNNTIRKAKDFINTTDTLLGDRKINLKNISQFYGIENGKLKVGDINMFDENTEVIPVRNKNIGKIKKILLEERKIPNYTKEVNDKYPTPNFFQRLFTSRDKLKKLKNDKIKYYNSLINNKVTPSSYFTKNIIKGINSNNDTIELKNSNNKLIFSDENGNAIFVNKLKDKEVRDKVNKSLELINRYPILVDNGRYSHYDLTGNVEGYVNPLDNKKNMFILGY